MITDIERERERERERTVKEKKNLIGVGFNNLACVGVEKPF